MCQALGLTGSSRRKSHCTQSVPVTVFNAMGALWKGLPNSKPTQESQFLCHDSPHEEELYSYGL
jgi:hypothetical protein